MMKTIAADYRLALRSLRAPRAPDVTTASLAAAPRPYTGRSLVLVPTLLLCTSCKKQHDVRLPGDAILRRVLATLACPSCRTIGVLRLARKDETRG